MSPLVVSLLAALTALGPVATPLASPGPVAQSPEDPIAATREYDLCDNGDFEQAAWMPAAGIGTEIPWWRQSGKPARIVEGQLVTPPGSLLTQPFWCDRVAAGAGRFRIVGRVRGPGYLVLNIGTSTHSQTVELESDGEGLASFEFDSADLHEVALAGRDARIELGLRSSSGTTPAVWDDIRILVDLPDPSETELAALLVERIDTLVTRWAERGLDQAGPRATTFAVQSFDVVTGEPLGLTPGGVGVFYETLLAAYDNERAAELAPEAHARWRALLETHVPEFLELTLHPETSLPRLWDPLADQPLDTRPIEVARYLAFLIDLADHGPAATREQARAAAEAFGEAVLAGGLMANGEVASLYRASTGRGDTGVPGIRKLDMPAELVRLAELTGDERYLDAALGALSEFEYLHMWGGTWDAIDPGLDDIYGHFGVRSVTMLAAWPELPMLGRIASGGLDYFGPLWSRTLAHGAFVAADQIRGWRGFVGVAEFDPTRRAEVAGLIRLAVRAHLKGELDGAGRWVDVSHSRWEPRFGLEVGDVPGVPANLLEGLALAYHLAGLEGVGEALDRRFLRGAFAAVLASTEAAYGRPFGLLPARVEALGANPSGADMRLLPTYVALLEQL